MSIRAFLPLYRIVNPLGKRKSGLTGLIDLALAAVSVYFYYRYPLVRFLMAAAFAAFMAWALLLKKSPSAPADTALERSRDSGPAQAP